MNNPLSEYYRGRSNVFSEMLDEIRRERQTLHSKNLDRQYEYLVKLAELSLLFGAGLVPVFLASDTKISQPIYLILAVVVYLVNGFMVYWRAKELIESESNQIPHYNLRSERDIARLRHAVSKLTKYPEDAELQKEYYSLLDDYISRNNPYKVSKVLEVNYWLDGALTVFIVASWLLVKLMWPFSELLYFHISTLILLAICILIYLGYLRLNKSHTRVVRIYKQINKEMQSFIVWEKSNQ